MTSGMMEMLAALDAGKGLSRKPGQMAGEGGKLVYEHHFSDLSAMADQVPGQVPRRCQGCTRGLG
jgi:hypothetical protein